MAIGMLTVCAIMVVTVIRLHERRPANVVVQQDSLTAFDAADAGMNNTYAVLNLPTNNSLHPDILPSCHTTNPDTGNGAGRRRTRPGSAARQTSPPRPAGTTHLRQRATVDWCGDLDRSGASVVPLVGRAPQESHRADERQCHRTLFSKVSVVPTMTQPLNNPSWNYIYATSHRQRLRPDVQQQRRRQLAHVRRRKPLPREQRRRRLGR